MQSRIVQAAHRINRGEMPEGETETAAERVIALVATRIPERSGFDPVQDIQVLCPMSRGGAGARALSLALQEALNPEPGRRSSASAGASPPATR